ncbi:MAG: amino acid ABC transporter permease [Treponema sp.]|jgi:L-cystine transport system permease protein|nr:amino acid ABC transporter permease [Treponema sp.]
MELNLPFMLAALLRAAAAIPVTVNITAVSLLIASPLGFLLALCRIYRIRPLDTLAGIYISFIRGTPMVLQILIVYSILPSLLNAFTKSLGLGIDIFALPPIIYAWAVFSLNSAAGLSEIFRSALLTVDRGQMEAARALGMSTPLAYRLVILPQAFVFALPNLSNFTVTLIKNTSLAFIMTVRDITAVARIEAARGYNYIEAYLDIFLLYIALCGVVQWLFDRAERKLAKG